MIEYMASHVSQAPGSEIQPAAPFLRNIARVVGPVWCRTQPQIPTQVFGNRRSFKRPPYPLRPYRMGRPGMNFSYIPNGPVPNPFTEYADAFHGMSLISHLGGYSSFTCSFSESAGFKNCVCQWFFTKNMFTQL